MNVSGIRPYAGFYDYNSIKVNELRSQQIADAQQMQGVSAEMQDSAMAANAMQAGDASTEQQDARNNQTYSAYDYAKEFKPGESFDLKGADSDINSLDVEKAISGLEKDQVLKQYQFFVGDSFNLGNITQGTTASIVRAGENFSL